MSTTCKLWEFDVDEPTIGRVFRELIGSFLWIVLLSRPDIVNAVRAVARYCSAPEDDPVESGTWYFGVCTKDQ